MTERPAHDYGLESLLAMDGVVFVIEHGHWIKIEARVVASNRHVPHGVRYSLTLHEVFEYQFESAEKLLVDFWNDVYEMLFGVNRKK